MTTAMLDELVGDPRLLYRHTVDEYHQMIATGAVEEGAPFELLDGQVVHKIRGDVGGDPMSIGTHHMTVVTRMGDLNPKLRRLGCHLRLQGPLTLSHHDEPEPDGAIVKGTSDAYLNRHPSGIDVLCVIEVADASLKRDRGYKQRVYADSGIPAYVIINLSDRVVELYTRPMKGKGRYGQSVTLTSRQRVSVSLLGGKPFAVPVRTLLPSSNSTS